MDMSRNDLLGELAADAALERQDALVQATDQFRSFLDRHANRLRDLGGMTLIDDDPDYLSIAPDLSFRSRSRYQDDTTGEWVSETEVIESAAEIIELYNPADLYQAFAEAAREAAGLGVEPTGAEDLMGAAHVPAADTFTLGGNDPYVAAADEWAAGQDLDSVPQDDETAAHRLYDLALSFQERSQRSESRLLDEFASAADQLTSRLGDFIVIDDDDERLTLKALGGFRAEVVPEGADGEWRPLTNSEEIVEFYDPTDIFGDLADALVEAFPGIAPAAEAEDREEGAEDEAGGDDDGLIHPNGTGAHPSA